MEVMESPYLMMYNGIQLIYMRSFLSIIEFVNIKTLMYLFKTHNIIILFTLLIGCQSSNPAKSISADNPVADNGRIENQPNAEGLRHFMNGQMLMNQGDFPMAIIEFQQALTLDPNVGAIHTAIAECYWNIGKSELSNNHLEIAIEKDPNDVKALQLIADQFVLQKKYGEAEKYFEQLNKINPDDARYIIALAELQKIKKNYSAAMNLYLEAFSLEPNRYELLETAGRFAIQQNDYDQAKSIFKKLSQSFPDQEKYLAVFIDLLSQSKSFDEGIKHIESINEIHGETLERRAQLGLLYYRSGLTDKAHELLESVIKDSPNNPSYYFSLFDIYMEKLEYKKAADLADKLITNYPEDWRGYYSRSLVFMNENNSKAIIDLLEPVSEIFKSSFSIQYLIGLSHSRLKQYDEAINYYEKSHLIEPNSSNLLHSMAILYDATEDWKKSDSIYVHLIGIDSLDAQALNNYAYSLVERDQNLDNALIMARKAIDLEPNNASYLDTIGWIYFKLNKTEKAKHFLKSSLEIVEDNSVVLEHLGDVLMKDKKLKEAINYYKRALAIDKDNPILIEKVSPE